MFDSPHASTRRLALCAPEGRIAPIGASNRRRVLNRGRVLHRRRVLNWRRVSEAVLICEAVLVDHHGVDAMDVCGVGCVADVRSRSGQCPKRDERGL